MMEDGHCVATIHAEANAIIQAAKNGVRVDGADIYITASPCWNCFKIVTNAGIKNIYYGEFYRDDRIFDAAKQLKMLVSQISRYRKLNPIHVLLKKFSDLRKLLLCVRLDKLFCFFVLGYFFLGGDALNGCVKDGHYYLWGSRHGELIRSF